MFSTNISDVSLSPFFHIPVINEKQDERSAKKASVTVRTGSPLDLYYTRFFVNMWRYLFLLARPLCDEFEPHFYFYMVQFTLG